jgi:hypothetical protein
MSKSNAHDADKYTDLLTRLRRQVSTAQPSADDLQQERSLEDELERNRTWSESHPVYYVGEENWKRFRDLCHRERLSYREGFDRMLER